MSIEQILDDFEVLDSWDDRYRYVIELGRALPPFPDAERTDKNKVQGCASQVWMVSDTRPAKNGGGPVVELQGDSDAHIVKGLIAIFLAL
jgi:cysteine desulfuration protein SufE